MARIRVPRLSYQDLRGIADAFLRQHHPAGTIPIPIEEVVEFRFGIGITPLPGLHADHEIDGFVSADLSEIFVDLFVFESRPARYRFTLAHEIGHVVLHAEVLKEVRPRSVAEWKRFEIDCRGGLQLYFEDLVAHVGELPVVTTFDRVLRGRPARETPRSPLSRSVSSSGAGIQRSGSPMSMGS